MVMTTFAKYSIAISFLLAFLSANAVEKNKTYLDYISTYHKIAQEEMKNNGIPASITLAQGLLESGAGRSELTQRSNNHFGIKCHDWTGDKVYHDDDKLQECFRKYKKPEDSFADHSKFLKRPRYTSLFDLEPTDYKGWARGLKKCGYATDPRYADRLIDIIELYSLYEYDKKIEVEEVTPEQIETEKTEQKYLNESSMGSIPAGPYHKVSKIKGRRAVEARNGDTYESLAKEFGMRPWELRWCNRAHKGDTVAVGDIIYLKRW